VVNDTDIFRAVAPRIVAGGMLIIASTPWAEEGLLYDLHASDLGNPTTAIVAHAPTLAMRTELRIKARVALEYARDPDSAEREYGAQFIASSGSGVMFDPALIDDAVEAA